MLGPTGACHGGSFSGLTTRPARVPRKAGYRQRRRRANGAVTIIQKPTPDTKSTARLEAVALSDGAIEAVCAESRTRTISATATGRARPSAPGRGAGSRRSGTSGPSCCARTMRAPSRSSSSRRSRPESRGSWRTPRSSSQPPKSSSRLSLGPSSTRSTLRPTAPAATSRRPRAFAASSTSGSSKRVSWRTTRSPAPNSARPSPIC